jgi:phage virion morphogenesis protein
MTNGALISYEIKNDDKVKALLKKAGNKAKDLRVPLKRCGILMLSSIDKNFRAEGRPKRWAPLSPTTIAMRRKKGRGARILQDTGMGKGSITYEVVSNQKVQIGTRRDYMRIHQTGGNIKIPARTIRPVKAKALHWISNTGEDVFAMIVHQKARTAKIPQRKFLLFQEDDKKNIVRIFIEYLEEVIK